MKRILLLGLLFMSCTEPTHVTPKMQLRQMGYERTQKEITSTTFFIITRKENTEKNHVRMFAKTGRGYEFLDIPLEKISIIVDNNTKAPYIEFEHRHRSTSHLLLIMKDGWATDYTCYLYINEKYIPEEIKTIQL